MGDNLIRGHDGNYLAVDSDGSASMKISGRLGLITPTHTAEDVADASAVVLAANANRLYTLMINDSDAVIYLMFGQAAVGNQGIRLNAAGGSYEMSKELGNLYLGAVHAIHAGADGKRLLITEGS